MFNSGLFRLLLVCLLFCFSWQTLQAKKLYKYQDKEGRWFFTDRPPQTSQRVEVRQLKAGPKRYLWLERTGDKRKPEYFAINNYHGPVELEVDFKDKQNVLSKPALPKRFVLKPGRSDTLFQMAGANQYKSWKYTLQYRYTIGSPLAQHDEQYAYLPPFAKNQSFPISQAFGGEFSHQGAQSQYAVDIVMPVETPIHAARAGVVIEVNNDFFKNGIKQAYKSRANSIRILHDDGSMAVYAHLALETAQVYPGLKVHAGQLIGYSGNTGYSTGPHLHFAIQVNNGMELVSVPFKFIDGDGVAHPPIAGKMLRNL